MRYIHRTTTNWGPRFPLQPCAPCRSSPGVHTLNHTFQSFLSISRELLRLQVCLDPMWDPCGNYLRKYDQGRKNADSSAKCIRKIPLDKFLHSVHTYVSMAHSWIVASTADWPEGNRKCRQVCQIPWKMSWSRLGLKKHGESSVSYTSHQDVWKCENVVIYAEWEASYRTGFINDARSHCTWTHIHWKYRIPRGVI